MKSIREMSQEFRQTMMSTAAPSEKYARALDPQEYAGALSNVLADINDDLLQSAQRAALNIRNDAQVDRQQPDWARDAPQQAAAFRFALRGREE
jgi:hypothetical protein